MTKAISIFYFYFFFADMTVLPKGRQNIRELLYSSNNTEVNRGINYISVLNWPHYWMSKT